MYNVVENFLANPNEGTFKQIQGNKYLLTEVFKKDKELAKQFFGFEEWFLVFKDNNRLEEEEKDEAKAGMKDSISCFKDAFKYYHQLGYDDRIAYQPGLIQQANTVKDLLTCLAHVNQKYRAEIVEKMRKVAVTDDEKNTAFSYLIH